MRSSPCSRPSPGIDQALRVLLSSALSSRPTFRILIGLLMKSNIFALQFVINLPIVLHQRDAAIQDMRGLLGAESLPAAVTYAIKLAQVAIHRIQTVIGFASDLVGTFALGLSFMTDNPFVG